MGPGEIAVMYGDRPAGMVAALLDHLEVEAGIPRDRTIGIKPNLVLPSPSGSGATTDPEIIEAIVVYLHERGFEDVVILESAWVGASTKDAFSVCGYEEIAEQYGVTLIDLERDVSRRVAVDGDWIEVCERALGLGFLINVPVLKAHCQTRLTCALKNLKGCIPDREKRRFHTLGLHRPIARLNRVLATDLVIVDGIVGDLTFEEGGTPVRMNRLIAGRDPVLVDAYAAALLGYRPDEIEYIGLARELGVGSDDLQGARIDELNSAEQTCIRSPDHAAIESLTADRVIADQACSPCFGGLIHALQRLRDRDELHGIPAPISIGQGFEGGTGPGPGIGQCTSGMDLSCDGCPPSARDMLDFLLFTRVRSRS